MYLEVKNVWVSYDKVMALKGVSLGLEQGEIVALIGANGAGKTTLLRAITGLVKLAGGEIWFDGCHLDTQRPEQIVAMGISMVPEGRRVYPYMNVKDNLLMGAYRRSDKQGIGSDLERLFARFP
jgi:branched-chain amino acid transport system ATP-binding protein